MWVLEIWDKDGLYLLGSCTCDDPSGGSYACGCDCKAARQPRICKFSARYDRHIGEDGLDLGRPTDQSLIGQFCGSVSKPLTSGLHIKDPVFAVIRLSLRYTNVS